MNETETVRELQKVVPCNLSIPHIRPNSEVICELSYERMGVSENLAKLNKAIEADPEAVSAHHKELWRKQAKAMQEYVDVLGERIKDLIDNG